MSTTIIAVIVNLLATLLPLIGVEFDSAELTSSIQTIVAVLTGIWIWYQRTTLQKASFSNGDVTALGFRK